MAFENITELLAMLQSANEKLDVLLGEMPDVDSVVKARGELEDKVHQLTSNIEGMAHHIICLDLDNWEGHDIEGCPVCSLKGGPSIVKGVR